jgi:hypothetical protein
MTYLYGEQYNLQLNSAANGAVEYVMDKILEEYKDLINQIVYDNYSPAVYDRTYGFRDSWKTKTQATSDGGEGTLYDDYNSMSVDAENFIHGSLYYKTLDVRDILTGLIFEGRSGEFFGSNGFWIQERDAWQPLLKELDGGKLDKWFIQGMRKQGFRISRI